jgi:hypothetical protein
MWGEPFTGRCSPKSDSPPAVVNRVKRVTFCYRHCSSARTYFASMTASEPRRLRRTVRANAQEPPGCSQRLARCVAMWCDAQRRVAERYDAPGRTALPTVMSISPTRLSDHANMAGREATSRQPCCRNRHLSFDRAEKPRLLQRDATKPVTVGFGADDYDARAWSRVKPAHSD